MSEDWSYRTISAMNPPDKPDSGKESRKPKPSRQDEGRKVIEEYR
jgi:hypothetical protein